MISEESKGNIRVKTIRQLVAVPLLNISLAAYSKVQLSFYQLETGNITCSKLDIKQD